jgi:hypothetical protein
MRAYGFLRAIFIGKVRREEVPRNGRNFHSLGKEDGWSELEIGRRKEKRKKELGD